MSYEIFTGKDSRIRRSLRGRGLFFGARCVVKGSIESHTCRSTLLQPAAIDATDSGSVKVGSPTVCDSILFPTFLQVAASRVSQLVGILVSALIDEEKPLLSSGFAMVEALLARPDRKSNE
jgi:hypothetical protein